MLEEVSVAKTHSSLNAAYSSQVLGRVVYPVPFGIEPEVPIVQPRPDGRLRVVAPGHDRDRDWPTLHSVARANEDIDVVVLTSRRSARRLVSAEVPNYVVRRVSGTAELIAEYAAADVVAVPLRPNMHASGITVALESIAAGRPLAITRAGGVETTCAPVRSTPNPGTQRDSRPQFDQQQPTDRMQT